MNKVLLSAFSQKKMLKKDLWNTRNFYFCGIFYFWIFQLHCNFCEIQSIVHSYRITKKYSFNLFTFILITFPEQFASVRLLAYSIINKDKETSQSGGNKIGSVCNFAGSNEAQWEKHSILNYECVKRARGDESAMRCRGGNASLREACAATDPTSWVL
jgi:hypothetical protein